MLDYDTWKLQGHDAGYDDPGHPCRHCFVAFEDHDDEAEGHQFEPAEKEDYDIERLGGD